MCAEDTTIVGPWLGKATWPHYLQPPFVISLTNPIIGNDKFNFTNKLGLISR